MAATLSVIDYAIIIISLVFSLGFGIYFAHRQKSHDHYFSGGRSLPPWAVGISILATLVSSITFLAYPGEGFKSNWILLVQGIMVVVILSGLVWFVVPLYRRAIGISAYEYFEKRFGFAARLYSSLSFSFTHFTKMGTVFFLLGMAISSMAGLDTLTVVWIVGAVIIIIALTGGMEAIVWLDVIQGFMFIGAGIVAALLIMFIPEGGPGAIFKTAFEYDKISFSPYDFDFTKLTFIVMVFNGIFYGIQKYGTDQTIIQRYLTTKTEKGAIKAAMMGVLLSLPVWAIFMFIGTALFAFYKITPFVLPEGIKAEAVFPYFILTQMPVGVIGLVISALVAAAVSTLDADMNSLSAVFVEDYYKRFKPQSTDKQQLRMGRTIVLLSGLLSLLIATIYVYSGGEGILGLVFELYAIFSGGIAGIFLLGIFSKRANKQGLYVGLIVCVLFTMYAVLTSTKYNGNPLMDWGVWNFPHHKYMLGVYTHIIVIVVGYLSSFLFKSDLAPDNLTIYGWWDELKVNRSNKRNGIVK